MTAAFGEPQYDDTAASADSTPSAQPVNGAAQEPEIDPNDPRLTSESLTVDATKDAYAMPPVLPDGKYRAKLKARDVGPEGKKQHSLPKLDRDGRPYLYTAVDASVIDHSGKFDGVIISDYFISTQLRRDGSAQAATLLAKLGKALTGATNHKQLMDSLLQALAAEPEVGIETAWEWSCQQCQDAAKAKGERGPRAVIGMHRFPQVKGQPDPMMNCPVSRAHGASRARPRVTRYLSLAELK